MDALCCRCACVVSVYVWWCANETRSRGEKGMARISATSPIECRGEKIFAFCQPSTPMDLSQLELLGVDLRGLRSASRRVSWGAGFPPFVSARRELLESVEKIFSPSANLLRPWNFLEPGVETCSCLCGARACGGGACAVQCRYGGAVHGSRTVWGAACVEREEGGEAAGGRLHTAMALLGLKVF